MTSSITHLKVKMMNRIGVLLFLLLVATFSGSAQTVSFEMDAPQNVQTGQPFRVSFSVNAQPERFRGPDFKGFDLLSGPNQSSSSSFQMINGQVTQSMSITYSYLVRLSQPGTYEIKSASVTVKGKEYTTRPASVKVSGAAVANQPRSNSNATSPSRQGSSGAATGKDLDESTGDMPTGEDIFIRAFVSKPDPMVGEQIIVTYKLYSRYSLSSLNFKNLPSYSGFWNQDLLDPKARIQPGQETYNGKRYVTAEIRKVALFPLKSGNYSISPLEITVMAQVQKQAKSRFNDPFFDQFFNDPIFNMTEQPVEMNIKSRPVSIKVNELPSANKPVDFSGAVGNYNLKATIDRTELKANEAVNLKVTITGTGNLEMIDKLPIVFPPDIEAYDPKVSTSLNKAGGVSGSKTFEYLLIPRSAGDFTIGPLNFSYYDLSARKYVTVSSEAFNLKVAKGDGAQGAVSYGSVDQKEVEQIGTDVRHIKLMPLPVYKEGDVLFGSLQYWVMLALALVVAVVFGVLVRKQQIAKGDIRALRLKKANNVARKRLKLANDYLQKRMEIEFYTEISLALWGYISDKFSIPRATLSMESVNEVLAEHNAPQEIIEQFVNTLNNTEFARFAPGDKDANMEEVYQQALDVITQAERIIR